MTVTEFLEARIAEDEAAAERGGWHNGGGTFANDNYGCLLVQPARVLAECAAKRAMLNIADRTVPLQVWNGAEWVEQPEAIERALAAVYKDHPDYRQEWAA